MIRIREMLIFLNQAVTYRRLGRLVTSSILKHSRIRQSITTQFPIMSKPVLYSYFRSSASWRVRIALELKGIEYEYRAVNLLKGQQKEKFSELNPMCQVPALEHNGVILTQSLAIIEYIEDVFPSHVSLFPKDPVAKARVLEISEIITSGIQPLQNLSVVTRVSPDDLEKRIEWANFWISKGFNALEKRLVQTSGKYCVGDSITMADCCLVPQAAATTRFKVDLSKFPNCKRVCEELAKLDAFQKADQFTQPDCPEDIRQQVTRDTSSAKDLPAY